MFDYKPPFLETAKKVGALAADTLKIILREQGHRLTGKLENSVEVLITYDPSDITATITVLFNSYGIPISTGIAANRIPYTRGSGAGSSALIMGLMEFAKKRGMGTNDAEYKRVAFAIIQAWKRDGGMPTVASRVFSKTGRRTGAIDETIETITPLVVELIQDIFTRSMGVFITDYLTTIIER
jgi:hypothetical protein